MKINVWSETLETADGNVVTIEYDGIPTVEFDSKIGLDELELLVDYIIARQKLKDGLWLEQQS